MKYRQWISKSEFENQILKSEKPRIVLFAADWCGYCKRFLTVVSDYDSAKVVLHPPSDEIEVVDVESEGGTLWDTMNLNLVPTLVVFSRGSEIYRRDGKALVGLRESDLVEALNTASGSSS